MEMKTEPLKKTSLPVSGLRAKAPAGLFESKQLDVITQDGANKRNLTRRLCNAVRDKSAIDSKSVKALLNQGANPNAALITALETSYFNLNVAVKLLVNAGADVNKMANTRFGEKTPLMLACHWDRSSGSETKDIVGILIDNGANVHARDQHDNTALILACMNPNLDTSEKCNPHYNDTTIAVIELLHRAGADMNARNKNGDTALAIATRAESFSVMRALRQHGATE